MSKISYIRCPHCGKSDGNDDIVLDKQIIDMNYSDCIISTVKQCDICGKKYEVITEYKFSYESLGEY